MSLLSEFQPASYDQWRNEAEASLKGAPFDKKLITATPEGISTQPIYNRSDLDGLQHLGSIPGAAPFVRGNSAAGSLGNPPFIAQEIPSATPKEFNASLRSDLDRGQTAVRILLDVATRDGLDPDQAIESDVACGGLSIASIDDLAKALDGVDPARTPLFISPGSAALPIFALLVALGKKLNRDIAGLSGAIAFDPAASLADRGSLPFDIDRAYDELAAITHWSAQRTPNFKTLCADSTAWHDAGADATQELAFALASGADTIRRLGTRGFEVNQLASRFQFVMGIGSDFFMEIAKFRAARLLWHRILVAFGGTGRPGIPILARTSRWNKSFLDPHTNLLRTTTEAFSAYVSGVEAVSVGGFDETFRAPDEFSRRIARNTQIILGEECSLNRVLDPAGGAYYPEWLTDQVARKAWTIFLEIESKGGMMQATLDGVPQEIVAKSADARLAALAQRRRNMVGVNIYANPSEELLPGQNPADASATRKKLRQKIADYRVSAEHGEAIETLDKLAGLLSSSPADLVDSAIDAALHGATLGEITKTLRAASAAKTTAPVLKARHAAEQFERLRLATESRRVQSGSRPIIFLACFGPIKQHKARAEFSRSFSEPGGFEVVPGKAAQSIDDAIRFALEAAPDAVVICSTDETYPELVPAFTTEIKRRKPGIIVILAGAPGDHEAAFKAAGVDDFIHLRANCRDTLAGIQQKIWSQPS